MPKNFGLSLGYKYEFKPVKAFVINHHKEIQRSFNTEVTDGC